MEKIKKRGYRYHFSALILLLFVILLSTSVIAQQDDNDSATNGAAKETPDAITDIEDADNEGIDDEVDEFKDAELTADEGITPDSAFYFVDEFFDQFGDEISVKEEKIAEIRAMVEARDIEAARISLESYQQEAEALVKEVTPDENEAVKRSAAAIRNTLEEIETDIPEEDRKEFVDDVIERESSIVTASEIASKIRDLCKTLSELDPVEYGRTCKIGDDAPEWRKRLHRELTAEQEKEAKAFFEIMAQCFETSGRECRCEDISVSAFADKCSVVAPLAVKCDEGDEDACNIMDDETESMEDLLPDYLQDVMRDVEERFGESQFDNFAPKECRDAGATTPKECFRIMFRIHAPPACIEAFDKGEIDPSNEREAREACEKIMFEENAPQECVEAGVTTPQECGKIMFKLNAPQECIDTGLTGDNRGDENKCRLIMESKGKGPGGYGPPAVGVRCNNIQDAEERLKCYDSAVQGASRYHEDVNRGPGGGGWPPQCRAAQALDKDSCEQVIRQEHEARFREVKEFEQNFAQQCQAKGGAWDCGYGGVTPENPCRCYFTEQREPYRPPQIESPQQQPFQQPQQPFQQPQQQPQQPQPIQCPEGQYFDSGINGCKSSTPPAETTPTTTTTTTPTTETTTTTTQTETTPTPTTETPAGTGSVITGNIISDNIFVNYFFDR